MKTHIMIHHSFTVDTTSTTWGAIQKYHTQVQGWKDIGYNYGVEQLLDGGYYALVGRAEHLPAAACKEGQMNEVALHICVVGNYDLKAPPPAALDVLCERLIKPLMLRYSIPVANIIGHRDYATYKSCPGKLFDLNALRARLT